MFLGERLSKYVSETVRTEEEEVTREDVKVRDRLAPGSDEYPTKVILSPPSTYCNLLDMSLDLEVRVW